MTPWGGKGLCPSVLELVVPRGPLPCTWPHRAGAGSACAKARGSQSLPECVLLNKAARPLEMFLSTSSKAEQR